MAVRSIDIAEDSIFRDGDILDILLLDRTTKKNIIWATDSYISKGGVFNESNQIKPELITGYYGKLIQPRAAKSAKEQLHRTKEKAEVFTPLDVIKKMNNLVDENFKITSESWQEYVSQLKLEITCGEAPFIVTRYNPTAKSSKILKLQNRVGFLDRKLQAVSSYCIEKDEWLKWAKIAYQSSYGYEWQGDNLLIARENLLYTLTDYYEDKFGKALDITIQTEFAEIINWNIFQMDGIRYVIPMSCKHETKIIPGELTLFGETPDIVEKNECEGCKFNRPQKHNGKYVKIMDWIENKTTSFHELVV